MGKGTFIALVALLIAIAGAIVAFAAYFKHRSCTICDDFDEGFMDDDDLSDLDYYATQVGGEDEFPDYIDTDSAQSAPEEKKQPAAPESAQGDAQAQE